MTYEIEFKRSALRELGKLPKEFSRRVGLEIEKLAADPYPPGCKKLHGEMNLFRIRVGEYRVIYSIDGAKLIITIIRVGHRKDVYR
jgi:mRNA interferase RelE/StbE